MPWWFLRFGVTFSQLELHCSADTPTSNLTKNPHFEDLSEGDLFAIGSLLPWAGGSLFFCLSRRKVDRKEEDTEIVTHGKDRPRCNPKSRRAS